LRDMHDHAWNDESYFASPHKGERKYVSIDSHIMCTPAIGDVDNDGYEELVVGASYFFDQEYYNKPVGPRGCHRVLEELLLLLSLQWEGGNIKLGGERGGGGISRAFFQRMAGHHALLMGLL